MAKNNTVTQPATIPATQSEIIREAINQLRAEAKNADAKLTNTTDTRALIEAAKASTAKNGDAEKALWRQFYMARIDELNAEMEAVRKGLQASGSKLIEATDEFTRRDEAWQRVHDNSDFTPEQQVESYKARCYAQRALVAVNAEREPLRADRDAIAEELDKAREQLRRYQSKPMGMALDYSPNGAAAVLEGVG